MPTATDDLGSIFADAAAYADPDALARRRPAHPGGVADPAGALEPEYPEFWAITKHADVMEVERNPEVFTNAPVPVARSEGEPADAAESRR